MANTILNLDGIKFLEEIEEEPNVNKLVNDFIKGYLEGIKYQINEITPTSEEIILKISGEVELNKMSIKIKNQTVNLIAPNNIRGLILNLLIDWELFVV